MLLSPDEADLFLKLHRSLMFYLNQQLEVVPNFPSPQAFSELPPKNRLEIRNALLEQPNLFASFIAENPAELSEEELQIVRSWQDHQVSGRFFMFRQLKDYMVFLPVGEDAIAYGVVALNDDFRQAKERMGGVVTSLPAKPHPAPKPNAKKPPTRRTTRSASQEVTPILESIIAQTDQFCREQLNEEYAELCRKLAEKLSRKRPSPLFRGRPNTWASGIVRTIGWVNFLHDPSQTPHLRLMDIDEWFGISESTGAAKLKEIRTMFRIRQFDPHWTLPSHLDDNPLIWMLNINGFLMDVRNAPREVQEIAFKKGLIPYIPGEQ